MRTKQMIIIDVIEREGFEFSTYFMSTLLHIQFCEPPERYDLTKYLNGICYNAGNTVREDLAYNILFWGACNESESVLEDFRKFVQEYYDKIGVSFSWGDYE